MRTTPTTALLVLLLLFSYSLTTTAQILNAPEPIADPSGGGTSGWTAACASSGFNSYWVNFTWINAPAVNSDNKFILELSDSNGNFGSPVALATLDDKNSNYDFNIQFALPTDTRGENYKIRVKSTSPEKVSPVAGPYSMYYVDFNSPILMSQDGNGNIPSGGTIEVCDGTAITMAPHNVPNASTYKYNWYKSGTLLSEKGPSLTTTEAGMYSVQIDYGTICSGSASTDSNIIEVTTGTSLGVALNTPSKTSLCSTETETLTANISGQGLTYVWYKDDVAITSPTVDNHTYTVDGATAGFEGNYAVEISGPGACLERSAAISITTASNVTLTRDNEANLVILPTKTKTLQVTSSSTAVTYAWYKDGVVLSGETTNTLVVNSAGEYFARIADNGGSCPFTIDSDKTTVVSPASFNIAIDYTAAYTDCQNTTTTLDVKTIEAVAADGTKTDVTADLKNEFTYQWKKDGVAISGETNNAIALSDITANGDYTLNASISGYSATDSNTLGVILLTSETVAITASTTTFCNPSNPVVLSTTTALAGETFTWYKDGVSYNNTDETLSSTETGTFVLEVLKNGCPLRSNEVVISPLNEDLITLDSADPVILIEGQTKTISANGGTSYQWLDAANVELSTSSSVTITAEGTYTLIAKIDDCEIIKQFTVEYKDTFNVPNVVTPNGDGKNDLWVLPNSYSNNPNATVIIYNSNGEEILNEKGYKNNWPTSTMSFPKQNMVFYYKILDDKGGQKQGTITIIR
ncbi:gliding motility-associated C-terminal domain-containing protein [Cellulophaga omnivescoria]|uniref:T9SS type B sorting domain-containing protein n=1 Tax=Cellulophaga omnivescoria TaxID=1888890 RepID=UPI00098529C4|nr:gliding motility-associated C-terminal domain-containing protein [Cellulophaga omnivescoria]WBU90659.1 gliding motility-associated C-terminal domain-containing protein [Cellulophaga omnivescoria]